MLWKTPKVQQRELEQRRVKAELLLAASALLGVDALGVGEGDLAFGLDFLTAGAQEHSLPYVSANLASEASGELVFPAYRVVDKTGLRIGLTSVIREGRRFEGVQIRPPVEALSSVVGSLRDEEKVDLVVLLSNLGLETDQEIAAQVEGIDLVFGSRSRRFQIDPVVVGRTAIFQAGSRGKYVGEASIDFVQGGVGWSNSEGRDKALRRQEQLQEQLARYTQQLEEATDEASRERLERIQGLTQRRLEQLVVPPEPEGEGHKIVGVQVPMGKDLADQAEMKALVDAALEKLGETAVAAGVTASGRTDFGDYVGASACLGCHASQYEDWKGTPHAHAYRTLVREKRQFDQDCWACHVTGAGRSGGPEHPKDVGSMKDVQCEACHGPGRAHVAKPGPGQMKRTPSEGLCKDCHTDEQTEGRFVYDEYLPKVDHR